MTTRSNGLDIGKFQIGGRRWIIGSTYVGTRATVGIDCESRDAATGQELDPVETQEAPPAGFTYIHDINIQECQIGIRAMAGYYSVVGGELVYHQYESNCDQVTVERIAFFGNGECFRFENNQAVGWNIRDISVNMVDGNDVTVFNVLRGGDISASGIMLNHRQVYLYVQSLDDQNTSCSRLRDVVWDVGVNLPGKFLCLYKYDGALRSNMSDVHAAVEITGHWKYRDPSTYDLTKIIQVPRGRNFNLSNIHIKMIGMPTTHFIDIGGGFYTPDPNYWAN